MPPTKMLHEDVDWNAFVQQPDNKTEGRFTEATKRRILHVKLNFQKFSSKLNPPKYEHWIKNITLRLIEGFLRWYLNEHNMKYQSGFLVFARYFRIFWCEEMDSLFPYDLRRRMTRAGCYPSIINDRH
ncbi:uncharacterized protein LDX57_001975 [Aspergillus melleus]|uniref:uncharacterized protein n=1 Tax=Aspergillus melleus TaxID=138277 RepID=UPI001E8D27C4|nr:uncharacterized protein LDX57_001975 [Aspergillus melleus]KAH8424218.1 hypothetical protein LDX57_001975 [Aspergillus melleus]